MDRMTGLSAERDWAGQGKARQGMAGKSRADTIKKAVDSNFTCAYPQQSI